MMLLGHFSICESPKAIENERSGNRNYKYLVPTKLIFNGTYIKKIRNLSSKNVMSHDYSKSNYEIDIYFLWKIK